MKQFNESDLNDFFQVIKHGDSEHQEWLAKVIEEFFEVTIERKLEVNND